MSAASPLPTSSPFKGIFIRAPIVEKVLTPGAEHGTDITQDEQDGHGSVVAPERQPKDKLALDLAHGEVEVLASLRRRGDENYNKDEKVSKEKAGDVIAVKQGNVFGTSFHPELSGDPRIHVWWLEQALDLIEKMHRGER